MQDELRNALFKNYKVGQGELSSGAAYRDTRAQWSYYDANYRCYVKNIPLESCIVEIGPGPGNLLSWLRELGFRNLVGVDASPDDVAFANENFGENIVCLGDGTEFLRERRNSYDVVIMKAMLEHQPKDRLIATIESAAKALKPNGVLLVDVPNMDWILSGHERYMDLTHEVGFTRESLTSLLRLLFEDVSIVGSVPGQLTRSQRWARKPLIGILRRLFYILGEGASDVLFESRSIIAVARRRKLEQ